MELFSVCGSRICYFVLGSFSRFFHKTAYEIQIPLKKKVRDAVPSHDELSNRSLELLGTDERKITFCHDGDCREDLSGLANRKPRKAFFKALRLYSFVFHAHSIACQTSIANWLYCCQLILEQIVVNNSSTAARCRGCEFFRGLWLRFGGC